jgi:hypothetical protein
VVTRRPLLAILLLAVSLAPAVRSAPTAEYRVKAAFLLNFLHFVEWPPGTFASRDAPLVICVLGNDPFGEMLDETVEGESIDERRIVVRRARSVAELPPCQLLFISQSEGGRLQEILQQVGSTTPVLTVSDIDDFVSRGGTIGFFLDRNRIRFEIGLGTAQRRHLKLSSQLLSLGRRER